jgi:hypothetical protein
MSQGNQIRYSLARLYDEEKNTKAFSYNPFLRAIGLLGATGWELVSYQIASGGSSVGYFNRDEKIAVFKRQILVGRPVDDIKLTEFILP